MTEEKIDIGIIKANEITNSEIKKALLDKAMSILKEKFQTSDQLVVALELIKYAKTLH